MKKFITIGLITTFLFVDALVGTVVGAEKVIKWKLQSHWPSSSTSYQGSLVPLQKQIEKATDGRLIIEYFPAGSLVPSKEILNAVSRGMVQMGTGSGGYFQNKVVLGSIANGLPYSFKHLHEALYFQRNLGFEKMMQDAYAKFGVFYVTDNVYRTEMVLKKPIRSLADFNGRKLRSYGALSAFLTELGAAASYLPGAEIYPALASGVVEGAHWGAAQGARDMGFYEVTKYHMKPALSISGQTCFLTNQKAIDKLPKDIRKIFIPIMERHYLERAIEYEALESLALAEVQEKYKVQVVTIPPEEQKKIARIAMKLWEKEGAKSEENSKALKIMKDFLKKLGHI